MASHNEVALVISEEFQKYTLPGSVFRYGKVEGELEKRGFPLDRIRGKDHLPSRRNHGGSMRRVEDLKDEDHFHSD